MPQYIFILGRNARLSQAELDSVFPKTQRVSTTEHYAIYNLEHIDCSQTLRQLGGTIKIGKILEGKDIQNAIIRDLENSPSGKIVFGISGYDRNSKFKNQPASPAKRGENAKLQFKIKKLGLAIKKILKQQGQSVRFVTSRESTLSSVVVTKNKCQEFIIALGKLFKTCAVQKFEEYSFRDYGRPARDMQSGMLPPKLAKIMINLSRTSLDAPLADPFCGSGTILQEAVFLGYRHVIGCDVSEKAVQDAKKNMAWLKDHFRLPASTIKISVCDATNLSTIILSVGAIVTEPYLGPPLRGIESKERLHTIQQELETLYTKAINEFQKVLVRGGTIVMVFPRFRGLTGLSALRITEYAQKLKLQRVDTGDLIYSRPGQNIVREIAVFQKRA